MSYIDVAVPLVVGLYLLSLPASCVSKSTPLDKVEEKAAKIRLGGVVLLVVAAVYALLIMVQPQR